MGVYYHHHVCEVMARAQVCTKGSNISHFNAFGV